jgi:hypothetical protein
MNLLYLIVILTMWLPTALFYCWIPAFAWLALRAWKNKQRAAVLLAIGMAPVLIYAVDYLPAYVRHQRMAAVIKDAQKLPRLANPPRTLVVHGNGGGNGDRWEEFLVEMGAFDEVYLTHVNKPIRLTNERSPKCGDTPRRFSDPDIYTIRAGLLTCAARTSVDRIPDDGLHLYIGPSPRTPPGPVGPEPLPISRELRLITGDRQRIIGYWGIPKVDYPAFPPILTLGGFYPDLQPLQANVVRDYGVLAFVMERLELRPEDLKPKNLPSPEEIRAEFIRLRDSSDPQQQRLAGKIAASAGASALTREDIEPVLASDAIRRDLASEIGSDGFCRLVDRLCDFPESLIALCKQKTSYPKAHCDRMPQQCDWCKTATLCEPHYTGKIAGCGPEEVAARNATMAKFRLLP